MPEEIKVTQDKNLILLGTPEHRFLNQKEKCIKIVSLETGQQIVPDINRHGLTHIIWVIFMTHFSWKLNLTIKEKISRIFSRIHLQKCWRSASRIDHNMVQFWELIHENQRLVIWKNLNILLLHFLKMKWIKTNLLSDTQIRKSIFLTLVTLKPQERSNLTIGRMLKSFISFWNSSSYNFMSLFHFTSSSTWLQRFLSCSK